MEPGFLWLVAYAHGQGRLESERGANKHVLRRFLPLAKVVRDSIMTAQLQERVLPSTTNLNWSTSAAGTHGCYLHSLVQVRAGHSRLSQFSAEELALHGYWNGVATSSLEVLDMWEVVGEPIYPALVKMDSMKAPVQFDLFRRISLAVDMYDNLLLRRVGGTTTCRAQDVLQVAAVEVSKVRLLTVVEPVCELLLKQSWQYVSFPTDTRLPEGVLWPIWQNRWPIVDSVEEGMVRMEEVPDCSAHASMAVVDRMLLELARTGHEDASQCRLRLQNVWKWFDPQRVGRPQTCHANTRARWGAEQLLDGGMLAVNHSSKHHVDESVAIAGRALLGVHDSDANTSSEWYKSILRAHGGRVLPAPNYCDWWATQLLDIGLMLYRADALRDAENKYCTYFTADSSPIRDYNWLNTGYWIVAASFRGTNFTV
eukprot:2202380-Amphidinium_carterae.1